MQAVRKHFRPEFLNRLDEIILFGRLRRKIMDHIVDIQIGRLDSRSPNANRDLARREGENWLADAGYDPVYGARPLKRVIQRRLQDPLAQLLLVGKIGDGAEVKVSATRPALRSMARSSPRRRTSSAKRCLSASRSIRRSPLPL